MIDDHSPDAEADGSYSPPVVVDIDADGDREFAVIAAIQVSPT